MAGRALIPFQLTATLLLALLATSHAGGIAIYWGQNTGEATLSATCASRKYEFVILAFVFQFGQGRAPKLDLSGHCDASSGGCAVLSSDIRSCQRRGVKVLLSIGGGAGNYGLSSPADARCYLGGSSSSRPLGDAVLDGIDFDIELGSAKFWTTLPSKLAPQPACRCMLVSCAHGPQRHGQERRHGGAAERGAAVPVPDQWDGGAINTGLFDFVWVQFYNNPECQFSSGRSAFLDAWKQWESVPAGKIFLGLPASKDAAGTGFVPAGQLTSQGSSKYGGVMLWSKFYDDRTGYSSAIKSHV
ncbi:hypothetical protein GQ55_5G082700 [Panicum hallii var. hallii]|uniref:chitinase n=1 Tax=Panicum hallii var. hallii TaxID=1504633 RepID=A0A2T7DE35_9POAL|nr:hypothetical protein GQ55_5G082700 [Panicum hallii var. hallii]